MRGLILLGLMVCSVSQAFAHHELDELNPDELGYRITTGNCMVNASSLKRNIVATLEGVFIRSRLKPAEYKHDGPQIMLDVYTTCRGSLFFTRLSLIRNYFDVEVFGNSVAYVHYYSEEILVSGFDDFISEFKAVVENVVTVYIKEAEGF